MELFSQEEIARVMNDEAQKEMQRAKARENAGAIKVPGVYRCRVDSKKFKNKQGDMIITPNFFYAKDTENFCLSVNLTVVDGTANTPVGSYTIQNFVIAAGKPTRSNPQSMERFGTALNISKQRLGTLVGKEIIKNSKFDAPWLIEYLTSEFDIDNKVTRQHKMVNEVMVKLERAAYNNKEVLQLSAMAVAKPNDYSIEDLSDPVIVIPPPIDSGIKDFEDIESLNAADLTDPDVERY